MKTSFLFIAIIAILASCQLKEQKEQKEQNNIMSSEPQQGIAKEVLQTSNYTYILMNIDGKEIWIACIKMEVNIGKKYYFVENTKMENFQSKELNRLFDTIIFVEEINSEPSLFNQKSKNQAEYKTGLKDAKQDIKIKMTKGITCIADIYSNKNKYAGTVITVKGVVTKYNPDIMHKNWIHLQDGTQNDGHFDLAATSLANTRLGDTITLSGKLVLDKDFGYGYNYDVLLEDAVLK
jgi:hypothetical protein